MWAAQWQAATTTVTLAIFLFFLNPHLARISGAMLPTRWLWSSLHGCREHTPFALAASLACTWPREWRVLWPARCPPSLPQASHPHHHCWGGPPAAAGASDPGPHAAAPGLRRVSAAGSVGGGKVPWSRSEASPRGSCQPGPGICWLQHSPALLGVRSTPDVVHKKAGVRRNGGRLWGMLRKLWNLRQSWSIHPWDSTHTRDSIHTHRMYPLPNNGFHSFTW